MTGENPDQCGPCYALAVYDGPRHVGFLPRQGNVPVVEPDGVSLDLFYSESGVRSQARLRAFAYAPLTVAPYDLRERRPLDPIPVTEDDPMPLKDEETRETMPGSDARPQVAANVVDLGGVGLEVVSGSYRPDVARADRVATIADTCRSRERANLWEMARTLILAHHTLARLIDRLDSCGDGRVGL